MPSAPTTDAQVIFVEIRLDQVCEFDGQSRFLESHGFLHQRSIDQFAQTVLSCLGLDYILFGGRAGSRPNQIRSRGIPPSSLPKVSESLDVRWERLSLEPWGLPGGTQLRKWFPVLCQRSIGRLKYRL